MITAEGNYDADFYILLFVVAPVAILGIVGNVVCLVILKRNSYNIVTVKLFQAIVIANTLFIAFAIVSRVHEILSATTENMPVMITVVIEAYVKVAFIPLCHTIIVYLIVLVTLDRYITVFKPCGIAYLCHGDVAILRVIFAIVGLAIIVNLPHFFEMKISTAECEHVNLTTFEVTILSDNSSTTTAAAITVTTFRNAVLVLDDANADEELEAIHKDYAVLDSKTVPNGESLSGIGAILDADEEDDTEFYDPLHRCRHDINNLSDDENLGSLSAIQPFPSDFVNTPAHNAYRVFDLLATELIPVVLITVMNARLICVMQHLMVHRAKNIHAQRRSEYRAVLVTLVILVSVFVVCEMPMFILKLVELIDKLFNIRRTSRTPYVIFYSVGQLFVQISASTNFIVYFCGNPVHRQQLWALLRCSCADSGTNCEREDKDYEGGNQPERIDHTATERPAQVVISTANPTWRRCWRFLLNHEGVTTSVETESVYARMRSQRSLYNQYFRDTQLPSPLHHDCYFPADTVVTQHTYQIRFQPLFRL